MRLDSCAGLLFRLILFQSTAGLGVRFHHRFPWDKPYPSIEVDPVFSYPGNLCGQILRMVGSPGVTDGVFWRLTFVLFRATRSIVRS